MTTPEIQLVDALKARREILDRAEAELLGTVGAWVTFRHLPANAPARAQHVEALAKRIEECHAAYSAASDAWMDWLARDVVDEDRKSDETIAKLARGAA